MGRWKPRPRKWGGDGAVAPLDLQRLHTANTLRKAGQAQPSIAQDTEAAISADLHGAPRRRWNRRTGRVEPGDYTEEGN